MSIDEPLREADQQENISLPEHCQFLIGHEKQYACLLTQVTDQKLPNALLIHGPRGIGKASFAFCLAKDILKISGNEESISINEQIKLGSHPNLFVLRKKLQDSGKKFSQFIRINDILKMILSLRQTAGVNAYKICIIDSIDDCNINAANALLKILEEPPKNTLFILISHNVGALLPTIRSRTQALALRPLKNDEVLQILQNSNIEFNEHKLQSAIELAKGIPRTAFELVFLASIDIFTDLHNWLNSESQRKKASHLALVNKILKNGDTQEVFAKNILLDWIANEAKQVAIKPRINKYQLALITNLWEQSQIKLQQAKLYNLDKKQALIALFDNLLNYFEKLEKQQLQR